MSRVRSRTRLDPEVRRTQIAAAAARVFASRDPSEVSFEAVADEAGVSRSLVYSYFGDRGRLFAAAYDHEVERLDRSLVAVVAGVDDRRARLDAVVRAYLHFAATEPNVWHLIVSAGASRNEAVQAAISRRIDRIAASVDAPATARDPDARVLIRAVLGFLESAAVESLHRDGSGNDTDDVADLLLGVLWSGLSDLDLDLAT